MRKLVCILCLIFSVSSLAFASEPTDPVSITKTDWLVLNLNVNMIGLKENNKPMCFAEHNYLVTCIGFVGMSSKRERQIKDLVRADFDKITSKLGISGKVKLTLP